MQCVLTPLLVNFKRNNVSNELECYIAAQFVIVALVCSEIGKGWVLKEITVHVLELDVT